MRIPPTRHHRCCHNHAGPRSPSSFSFCFSRRRLFAFQPMKPFRYRPKLVLAPASVDSSRYVISIPSRYTAVGRIPIKGGAMVDRERAAFSSLVGSSAVLLLCQNIKNKKRVVRLAVGSLPPPAFFLRCETLTTLSLTSLATSAASQSWVRTSTKQSPNTTKLYYADNRASAMGVGASLRTGTLQKTGGTKSANMTRRAPKPERTPKAIHAIMLTSIIT